MAFVNPWLIVGAFGLDLVLGDPSWLPHPIRLIGRAISVLEKKLRRSVVPRLGERMAGILLTFLIVGASYGLTAFLIQLISQFNAYLGLLLSLYFATMILANKSLADEANEVLQQLRIDLPSARRQLARIVGRETAELSEPAIIRATVETVAENSNDGIIAPLFYLLLGGPPLAMAYKALNTLDSRVGYKTARYRVFGWASARLDDVANYLPARLCGLLLVMAASLTFRQGRRSFVVMRRDGRKHASPNAGIPEAAVAGALGIQLGGPNWYHGALYDKPWLGDVVMPVKRAHIRESILLLRASSGLMLLFSLVVSLL